MARNTHGQIVRSNRLKIHVSKTLQNYAKEVEERVKPRIRDEFESELRYQIYASEAPATDKGRAVEAYNETHKHQQKKPYHHTGKLASKIYAAIEGDDIVIRFQNYQYPNGKTVEEVYDMLKFGTAKTPHKISPKTGKPVNGFYFNGKKNFSPYISQPPHDFETETNRHMKEFMQDILDELRKNAEYINHGKHIKHK